MTKVETERENCIDALLLAQKGADEGMVYAQMDKGLDSLISAVDTAAFARGVAEGAEQVASQIREAAIPIIPEARICVDDKGFVFMDPCPYLGSKESYGAKVFLVGASVLAPTKEGEK